MRSHRIVVAPLLCTEVVKSGGDHVAWGTLPVRSHSPLLPAIHRAKFFLANVVRPATTIDTLGATHRRQSEESAVNGISVEIVVDTRTHDDLRAALRISSILRKLATDTDSCVRRNSR